MSLLWYPHPGPQTDFCETWEDEVLYGGAAGGGKTDCIINEASRFVPFPDYKGIILRRTFKQLEEILDRMQVFYPPMGGEYRAGDHRWHFPSGAKINVGHMQHDGDEYQYQTFQFQFIGFDEAGQFLPKQLLYMFSRCRSVNPLIPKRMRYGTNPGGPAHQFLKDRFKIQQYPMGRKTFYEDVEITLPDGPTIQERIARVFIPAKLKDNPTLLANDPGYVARLAQLPMIEQMRLIGGSWESFEGQVFSELNWELHGVDPFDIPPEWPRYRSFDWGYSAPYSVLWWANDTEGRVYLYREHYGAKRNDDRREWVGLKRTAAEIAREIKTIEHENENNNVRPGPADPSIWNKRRDIKTGVIGRSVADEMSEDGIHWIPADNNRILGKQQLHSRLRVDDQGNPSIFIFRNCEHTWRTLQELHEDPKNPEDVDTRQEDHIYDALKYYLMFQPMRAPVKVPVDIGSFQSERRKYLKARQHAQRYGVSMGDAYARMR